MIKALIATRAKNPKHFGVALALIGVLILTPDTLVMRLSGLEHWALIGWRGLLMGVTLLAIWRFWLATDPSKEWRSVMTLPGLAVVVAFGVNSITFTLGIAETSVTVVLTAVATMPVFAAALSALWLGERQGWAGWLMIGAVIAGIGVVVSDGSNAVGVPQGSPWLGAGYGLFTAFGLALTFTVIRKYPTLSILPAVALGAVASGTCGVVLSPSPALADGALWSVIAMGVVILPLSFTCLNIAPRYTTSSIVSLIMLLEMVIGPFWVWVGIGEQPTLTMVAGAAFVCVILLGYIARADQTGHPELP